MFMKFQISLQELIYIELHGLVLKRMGVNDSVTSPTFSILNEYDFA